MSGRNDPLEEPGQEQVPHRRRTDARFTIGVLVVAATLAWVVITMQQLSHELRTSNDARDALSRQVQGLGASPVAGPPGSRGEPGQSVVGPGGPRGYPGASGKAAPAITPSPGASGARGTSGKPGTDSTVPGPSGSPGQPGANSTVAGATGPPGRDGVDGKNGADGTNGRDGVPPAGWTWTWTDQTGVTHTYDCGPVSDFDKNNPKYQCTETSTSTPAPTNSPSPTSQGLLGLALVGDRRRWI